MIRDLLRELLDFVETVGGRLTDIENRLDQLEQPVEQPEPVPAPQPEPIQPPMTQPDSFYFFDNFDYSVGRGDTGYSNIDNPFVREGGWDWAKAINISGSYNGYLYTDNGWLVMEGVSEQGDGTDFYLQKGLEYSSERMPMDLEINFDLIVGDGEVVSDKLLYPTHNGYPEPGSSYSWLCVIRDSNFGWLGGESYERPRDPDSCYLMLLGSGFYWEKSAGDGPWKMAQTNPVPIRRNVPTHVRLRVNERDGIIQAWLNEAGQEPQLVIDAHHGQPVDGSPWHWNNRPQDGICAIRMPTTQGTNNTKMVTNFELKEWVG